jgi:hypothetical protein
MDDWSRSLAALAEKYRALLVMARERDDFEAAGVLQLTGAKRVERHGRARRLARQFPGALRELDGATVAGLTERLAGIEAELAARRGQESAPRWMRMVAEFHDELRERLRIKASVARGEHVTAEEAALIANAPYGRLQELVWQRLAVRYGMTTDEARAVVHGGKV